MDSENDSHQAIQDELRGGILALDVPYSTSCKFVASIRKGKPHMTLVTDLRHKIADPAITRDERARKRCELAKQLEIVGNYEGASEAMGELWQGIGERPAIEGLDQYTAAEVLLRVGVISESIGSIEQIDGVQEKAKDLLTESMRLFEALQKEEKVAEAQTEIAGCYWHGGELNESRAMLQSALNRLGNSDSEIKATALLRIAIIEQCAQRYNDALRIYMDAAPTFEKCSDHALQGKFHNEFANVL
ncbi:MAG TPA: tetratricopeptide repeat protein, partial [Pyrinomonadaceae bacterium]